MVMQPDLERERARQKLTGAAGASWQFGNCGMGCMYVMLLCKQLVSSDHLLTLSLATTLPHLWLGPQ